MNPAKRALVTGGGKGIGAAIARRLAGTGTFVVVADLDTAGAETVAREIDGAGVPVDVCDAAAMRDVVKAKGPFDILINNVGRDQHAFFTDTDEADWRRLIDANLFSVFSCTHAVLPAMQAAGYGRIVSIASEAGRLGSKGGSVYAAAKAGVIGFTKSIAQENARFGITANVIAPGPIDTPMLQTAVESGGPKLLDGMRNATLLRRLGTPDEVATAAAFLASEDAGYITGETLGVSGGMALGMA